MRAADVRSKGGSHFSTEELRAWGGFLGFHARMVRELSAALEASDRLRINEFELLLALSTSPDRRLAMSELADRAFLTQSGLSRLVDRLQQRGLVDRAPAEGDRRTRCVTVTDEGYALWRDASRGHRERVRAGFLDHLDDDELRRLGDLWDRLTPE